MARWMVFARQLPLQPRTIINADILCCCSSSAQVVVQRAARQQTVVRAVAQQDDGAAQSRRAALALAAAAVIGFVSVESAEANQAAAKSAPRESPDDRPSGVPLLPLP